MSKLFKGVVSTSEAVLPFERKGNYAYIRTNIVKIDSPEKLKVISEKEGLRLIDRSDLTDEDTIIEVIPSIHGWLYDEEVLDHTEYMERLEKKIAEQEEANLNVMIGLAEVYEAMNSEEVV